MARMLSNELWLRTSFVSLVLGGLCLAGCAKPKDETGRQNKTSTTPTTQTPTTPPGNPKPATPEEPTTSATASPADVKAARSRIDELGSRARYAPEEGDLLTEIVIQDGSKVTADDLMLFGKLADLEKFQILNCRTLNDEMVASLGGLKHLTSLAITNTVITDAAVQVIVKSFPDLTELDLSSNANMTNGVVKIISELTKLESLSLYQDRVNDIGAQRLSKLQDLRILDLRGNMEAGDLALEVISGLPKLKVLKHRSTAVTDSGMEYLSRSETLESLLIQDFAITDQSGQHLAKLAKLTQLEVFRCQGFGSEGVLALKGMGLIRLTLRDLPNVDDRSMEVFSDLPKLRRLYLHELGSVSDLGLSQLAALKTLEVLDIWSVSQMTDATVDVISKLPNLKDLSLRTTGITDASIDKLLAMPKLQSLTFKENGSVTADGLKKLSSKKWSKLDLGNSGKAESSE